MAGWAGHPENVGFIVLQRILIVLIALSGTAFASPITFNASGTFTSGATLGGSIVIDTTLGTVVSADLTASAPYNAVYDNNEAANDMYYSSFGFYGLSIDPGYRARGGSNVLELDLPVQTLVSYGGGILLSQSSPLSTTGYSVVSSISFDGLLTGSLTEVSVPEPPSLLLMSAGLGILLLFGIRRRT